MIGDCLVADIQGAIDFGIRAIYFNPEKKEVSFDGMSINHLLELKNIIRNILIEKDYDVTDHGAYEYDALDDYPDFIFPCATAVSLDNESKGIILGGSGEQML